MSTASFSGTILSTIVFPQLTTVEPTRTTVLDAAIKLRASSGDNNLRESL